MRKRICYRQVEREDLLRAQEGSHLQPKEEASEETNPADTLISNL